MKDKELKCPNCGAPINRLTMRCDYCGSVFKMDVHNVIYQVEHPKVVPLKAVMKVDDDIVMLDGYERCLVDHIADSLADKIAKYMEVDIQHDPARCQVTVSGRVRIVPPNVDIW